MSGMCCLSGLLLQCSADWSFQCMHMVPASKQASNQALVPLPLPLCMKEGSGLCMYYSWAVAPLSALHCGRCWGVVCSCIGAVVVVVVAPLLRYEEAMRSPFPPPTLPE